MRIEGQTVRVRRRATLARGFDDVIARRLASGHDFDGSRSSSSLLQRTLAEMLLTLRLLTVREAREAGEKRVK